jgi:hypothetical protein
MAEVLLLQQNEYSEAGASSLYVRPRPFRSSNDPLTPPVTGSAVVPARRSLTRLIFDLYTDFGPLQSRGAGPYHEIQSPLENQFERQRESGRITSDRLGAEQGLAAADAAEEERRDDTGCQAEDARKG